MNEHYKLRDEKGKVITVGTRDLMHRWMKHELPDGMYSIEGDTCDMTYYRIDGIVYPCSGSVDGKRIKPRSREECKQFFGEVAQ